jgi:Leucine-rich repeat (LRR) protein
LEQKAFGSLPVVFELRLDSNDMKEIDVRAFEGLLQLLRLNLSNNQIESIPPEAFKGLVSLRFLDLSVNKLSSLQNRTHGVLEDLLSLEKLNLSYNRLSFIRDKTFPRSPYIPYKLREIDLSHNYIPFLSSSFDDGMRQVEYLNLSHNILNEIRPNVITNITRLKYLDMSHNQLRMIPKDTFGKPLSNLTTILLGSNKIGSIYVNDLLEMNSLKILDLTNNELTGSVCEEMSDLRRKCVLIYLASNSSCPIRDKCTPRSPLRGRSYSYHTLFTSSTSRLSARSFLVDFLAEITLFWLFYFKSYEISYSF